MELKKLVKYICENLAKCKHFECAMCIYYCVWNRILLFSLEY